MAASSLFFQLSKEKAPRKQGFQLHTCTGPDKGGAGVIWKGSTVQDRYFFLATASFRALPARNLGTLAAAILISLPVCGFLPVRAFLLATSKLPKPTSVTRSPFFRALLTVVMKAPTAFSADALVRLA